jgi:hypothetical protein
VKYNGDFLATTRSSPANYTAAGELRGKSIDE